MQGTESPSLRQSAKTFRAAPRSAEQLSGVWFPPGYVRFEVQCIHKGKLCVSVGWPLILGDHGASLLCPREPQRPRLRGKDHPLISADRIVPRVREGPGAGSETCGL